MIIPCVYCDLGCGCPRPSLCQSHLKSPPLSSLVRNRDSLCHTDMIQVTTYDIRGVGAVVFGSDVSSGGLPLLGLCSAGVDYKSLVL